MQGELLIRNDEVKNNNAAVDLRVLPKANYLLKITTKDGHVGTVKVQKE